MSSLTILPFSDPLLRKSIPLLSLDHTIEPMIKVLTEMMYIIDIWGVAAPEVGIDARLFVMDLSKDRNQPRYFINPEITHKEGHIVSEEDALCLPNLNITVPRAKIVTLSYQDLSGAQQTLNADYLEAICIQQKVDQLNGKRLLDNLSRLKQERLVKRWQKQAASHACGHGCGHDH